MPSPLVVREVTSRDVFDAVVDVEWAAMHDPFRADFPWMHPVYGFSDEDRQMSIRKDADRRWESHINNPASTWFCVVDTTNDQVVGAAEWQVNTENPFPDGPVRLEATWYPPGEVRDFASSVMNQCMYGRLNWMNRPHITLNGMAVMPNARGRGVGSLLMSWGLQKAEELNLECFLEASDPGMDLYEKFGFRSLMKFAVNTHKKNASQAWMRLENETPQVTGMFMWRPAPTDIQNDLQNGTTTTLWEVMRRPTT